MNIKSYVFGVAVVALSLLAIAEAGYLAFTGTKASPVAINSFEDCVKAGLPILETYPEQCKTPDGQTFIRVISEPIVPPQETENPQHGAGLNPPTLVSPLVHTKIKSPLSVTGDAAGPWYFEASFPVILKDANGNILAQTGAQAMGDWMSTGTVPFSATLTWSTTTATSGIIILKKDNPSGLPEYDGEAVFPVLF